MVVVGEDFPFLSLLFLHVMKGIVSPLSGVTILREDTAGVRESASATHVRKIIGISTRNMIESEDDDEGTIIVTYLRQEDGEGKKGINFSVGLKRYLTCRKVSLWRNDSRERHAKWRRRKEAKVAFSSFQSCLSESRAPRLFKLTSQIV